MAGLGLALLGFMVLQLSGILIRYPASQKAPPPWPYLTARATGYSLIVMGIILLFISFS